MIKMREKNNGEISITMSNKGTLSFYIDKNIKTRKGLNAIDFFSEIIKRANKNTFDEWQPCIRNVGSRNRKKINKALRHRDLSIALSNLFNEIRDIVPSFSGVFTKQMVIDKLNDDKRKWLDEEGNATRFQLESLICEGLIKKVHQADEEADNKGSWNKYKNINRPICVFFNAENRFGCLQCSAKNTKPLKLGKLREED